MPEARAASVGVMERHEPQLKSGGADGGWLDVGGREAGGGGDGAAALASLERALTLSGTSRVDAAAARVALRALRAG